MPFTRSSFGAVHRAQQIEEHVERAGRDRAASLVSTKERDVLVVPVAVERAVVVP